MLIITARIQRMGKVIFSLCVSVDTSTGEGVPHPTNGGTPPISGPGWGYPHLRSKMGIPHPRSGLGVVTQGTPHQDWMGDPHGDWMGYPHGDWMGYPPLGLNGGIPHQDWMGVPSHQYWIGYPPLRLDGVPPTPNREIGK